MEKKQSLLTSYRHLINAYGKYRDHAYQLMDEVRETVQFEYFIIEELAKGFYLLIEDGSDRKAPLKNCLEEIEKKGMLTLEDFAALVEQ